MSSQHKNQGGHQPLVKLQTGAHIIEKFNRIEKAYLSSAVHENIRRYKPLLDEFANYDSSSMPAQFDSLSTAKDTVNRLQEFISLGTQLSHSGLPHVSVDTFVSLLPF